MRPISILILTALVLAAPVGAEEAKSFADALSKGKPKLALRYRFENVSEDAFDKDAHASTLRTLLRWDSADYKGFTLFLEAENVAVVGNDLYNNRGAGSAGNGVTDRPVVADPALTEINQAGLRFANEEWQVGAGRQEIVLGDVRYVGNVAWRQNHQSFDAIRIDNSSLEKVDFTYGFVDQVNRIFGDSQEMASHLFNAVVDTGAAGRLTLYGYWLDYDDPGAAALSSATYGAELAGKRQLRDGFSFLYELEYADQGDHGDNPNNLDAGYSFVMLGAALPKVTVKLGWEVLEGSPRDGSFRTPLATLHKFNGWADKFLATPPTGLEDLYLQLGGSAGEFDWVVKYHDFDSDTGSIAYGTELDFQLLYRSPFKAVFGLKGALYDADAFSTDTEKLWIWTAYTF